MDASPNSTDGKKPRQRSVINEDSHFKKLEHSYKQTLERKTSENAEARKLRESQLQREQEELDNQNLETNTNYYVEPSQLETINSYRNKYTDKESTKSLREIEDKAKRLTLEKAELEVDKTKLYYENNKFKDLIEEYEMTIGILKREQKTKNSELGYQKKELEAALRKIEQLKFQIKERDEILVANGLGETGAGDGNPGIIKSNILSKEAIDALNESSKTNLLNDSIQSDFNESYSTQIIRIISEKELLIQQNKDLTENNDLSFEYNTNQNKPNTMNIDDILGDSRVEARISDIQRNCLEKVAKFKLEAQKASQDLVFLQANLQRVEGQAARYKELSKSYEDSETDLKSERRKLVRENHEQKNKIEELETTREHLEKRIERLRHTTRDRYDNPRAGSERALFKNLE